MKPQFFMVFIVLPLLVKSKIDERYLDESIDPCDDFHQFACGNFKKYHQRPEDEDSVDLFTMTENDLVQIGKDILSSPKHENDPISLKKVKAAYKACLDVENLDQLFYYQTPEKKIISEYDGMPLVNSHSEKLSWQQIGDISGRFGIHHLFQFVVKNFDPESYIMIMTSDSFETPQLIRPEITKTYDEILDESLKKMGKQKRALKGDDPLDVFLWKSVKYFNSMFENIKSDEELKKDLDDVKKFMIQLFANGIDDGNMINLNNSVTLGELQKWTLEQFNGEIDIDWILFLKQHFQKADIEIDENFELFLLMPKTIYGILNLVRQTDPKIVKNFILLRTFLYLSPDSDKVMRDAFKEYYTSLGLKFYNREEYCTRKLLDVVDSASLSFAITNNFINYHFNLNKIPEAVKIINQTGEAFKKVVPTLDWLDDQSREAVLEKINNIIIDLAFPEFIENTTKLDHFYENVKICEWDNYGNSQRIRAFKQAYSFSIFKHHNIWTRSPFLVNAYALQSSTKIFSPVSLLQTSYFKGNDPIFDFSRFGTIISHEMVHHFDPAGINYDQDGLQTGLLTDSVKDRYNEKLQCFVDFYNQFYIEEINEFVNGSKTLNENLADVSGTKHAFLAFQDRLQNEIVVSEGGKYTPDQEFFINYATGWCSDESVDYLRKIVTGNAHSPNRVRILGTLSNLDEFSQTFNCPNGAKMNPVEKCKLW